MQCGSAYRSDDLRPVPLSCLCHVTMRGLVRVLMESPGRPRLRLEGLRISPLDHPEVVEDLVDLLVVVVVIVVAVGLEGLRIGAGHDAPVVVNVAGVEPDVMVGDGSGGLGIGPRHLPVLQPNVVLVAGDVEAEHLEGGGIGIGHLDDPEVGAADPLVVDHVVVLAILLAQGLEARRIDAAGQLDLVLKHHGKLGDGACSFLVDALAVEADVRAIPRVAVSEN